MNGALLPRTCERLHFTRGHFQRTLPTDSPSLACCCCRCRQPRRCVDYSGARARARGEERGRERAPAAAGRPTRPSVPPPPPRDNAERTSIRVHAAPSRREIPDMLSIASFATLYLRHCLECAARASSQLFYGRAVFPLNEPEGSLCTFNTYIKWSCSFLLL